MKTNFNDVAFGSTHAKMPPSPLWANLRPALLVGLVPVVFGCLGLAVNGAFRLAAGALGFEKTVPTPAPSFSATCTAAAVGHDCAGRENLLALTFTVPIAPPKPGGPMAPEIRRALVLAIERSLAEPVPVSRERPDPLPPATVALAPVP